MEEGKIFLRVFEYSALVASMGLAVWMLWKALREKDKLIQEQNRELAKMYIQNTEVMKTLTGVIEGFEEIVIKEIGTMNHRIEKLESAINDLRREVPKSA